MDFLKSASLLIPSLTGIPVTFYKDSCDKLDEFEKQYCFLPAVQTSLTAKYLHGFFFSREKKKLYQFFEPLGTQLVAFYAYGQWILLGPYVENAWNDGEIKTLLATLGLPANVFMPFKLYRCRLTIAAAGNVIRAATMLIENTVGNNPPLELKQIQLGDSNADLGLLEYGDEVAIVNERYDIEDRFIEAIRNGNTKKAADMFVALSSLSVGLSYSSNEISAHIAGAAIVRTIARRAAVQAGLAPVVVDSISQQYAQLMHRVKSRDELAGLQIRFITKLCKAVRQNKEKTYSIHIYKIIQYIDLNLSKSIAISELADVAGLSKPYLAKLFHDEVGMTIQQYIAKERVHKAAELLKDSGLAVQEISVYVGYPDNNYFAKVFKTHIGISPSEYRKKYAI